MKVKRHYLLALTSSIVGLFVGLIALRLIHHEQPGNLTTTTTIATSTNSSTITSETEPSETGMEEESLQERIREITVKIAGEYDLGSGIIIHREGKVYTVLTNEHVVRGEKDYKIRTPDNRLHEAKRIINKNLDNYDLALVEFESEDGNYEVAMIGNSSQVREGEKVVAAGFPGMSDRADESGFKFTEGLITLILDKAIEEGYQIGYTNEIEKGMSGGPMLNHRGELIGINGIHAYPLWDDVYLYQDGSEPCPPLQEIMNYSSWAIPINTFLELVPKYAQYQVKSPGHQFEVVGEEQLAIQAKAEKAKHCELENSQ